MNILQSAYIVIQNLVDVVIAWICLQNLIRRKKMNREAEFKKYSKKAKYCTHSELFTFNIINVIYSK